MKKFATFAVLSLAVVVVLTAGCNNEDHAAAPVSAASAVSLPAGLVATEAPAGGKDVTALKASAKDGEAVVVNGWVGGAEDPIAKNRAIMTVADAGLPNCKATPMDTCATPWDSCCEPVETRTAKTVTVQVVDDKGKPLAANLESVAGLKPLSKVTVAGIARRPAGSDVLVVEAKQIHVTPQ